MSSAAQQTEYMLGRTNAEHERLMRQGRLISTITRHFLEEMGMRSGMRVLDVGSGVGDVALMAARMVSPGGEVVGIDLDESALNVARKRAASEGLRNVEFRLSDLRNYDDEGLFDAAIGRCVLLHQHNPIDALRSIVKHVRSGGMVGFQEPWFSRGFSFPKMPLFDQVIGWLHASVRASGLDADIGVKLPAIFAAAGLPTPKLSFEMLADCYPESGSWQFIVDTVRSLMPSLEQLGIVHSDSVQLDTLKDQLREEQIKLGSVIGVMPLMGAWCRRV